MPVTLPAITPGPWSHTHDAVYTGDGRDPLDPYDVGIEEQEANAKAIAAVPQNLEAGIKAHRVLDAMLFGVAVNSGDLAEALNDLDAALRLAGVEL